MSLPPGLPIAGAPTPRHRNPRLPDAVSAQDLAKWAGVSVRTVYRWVNEYGCPALRYPGRVMIPVADFLDWGRGSGKEVR